MSQNSGDQGPGTAYKGYTVYDQHYEKVGKVDDLFVDENDQPEYIGVKMGLLGTKSTLIPIELVRVNDRRHLVEVAADEATIKHAPTFEDDKDITPEYEHGVYGYFGLESPVSGQERGTYGGYYASDPYRDEELRRSVDTEYGERSGDPGRPAETTPPGTSGRRNLDVPLDEPGGAGSGARPAGEGAAAAPGDPFDADAAIRTGGENREDMGVQEDRNVRVYKRAARPAR
ncbi:MAG: hypothetical protein AVDCRST_MAG02-3217 [uncultured Rubrobacteraceae bacterium]|uniref:PRC-barrel domain-containing protein n=1 Tax=uncultured Rubrobacteraceae bacterium TaxID=349277 RepID=A0A6J4R9T2_9ACTN|nr:MAG: hypothetical protein AVDCRST_MAG02-3217 [uncultured Rubrobacteraceae bacterium]